MIKKQIFIILLVFMSLHTFAQMDFGIKGGINLARLSGKETEKVGLKVGVLAGVLVEFRLDNKWALQPELLYSEQGASQEFEITQGGDVVSTLSITQTQDYLLVPVVSKYYVTNYFYFEAGPQIGFLIHAKGESDFDGEEVDLKEEIRDVDFAINLGFGYRTEGGFFISARYSQGLSNVNEDITFDEQSNDITVFNQKNQVFHLGIGYFF